VNPPRRVGIGRHRDAGPAARGGGEHGDGGAS